MHIVRVVTDVTKYSLILGGAGGGGGCGTITSKECRSACGPHLHSARQRRRTFTPTTAFRSNPVAGGWWVGRLVGWLVGRLVGWSAGPRQHRIALIIRRHLVWPVNRLTLGV